MRRPGNVVLHAFLFSATVAGVATAQPFAYVTNQGSNTISGYTVNPGTGTLLALPASPFQAGNGPDNVQFTPNGKLGYVTNNADSTVSGYALNGTNGDLVSIAGSPYTTGGNPLGLAISPSGKFLYTANYTGNSVSAFSINGATGALTPVSGSPFLTGSAGAQSLTFTPTGEYLYVSNGTVSGGSVSGFAVAANGTLATISGSPFLGGVSGGGAVSASGNFLYIPTMGGSIVIYNIDSSTGALSILEMFYNGSPADVTAVTTNSGEYLYAAGGILNASVQEYQIDTDGTLTSLPGYSVFAGPDPVFVAASGSGKFLYAADFSGNEISGYSIDSATGLLTAVSDSPIAAGAGPTSVALVDPSKTECGALDVTREATLTPGPYTHQSGSELFDEALTITNGIRPIAGPFSVVLLGLPSATTTLSGTYPGLSTTYCFSAAGNYVVPIDALLPPVNEGVLKGKRSSLRAFGVPGDGGWENDCAVGL